MGSALLHTHTREREERERKRKRERERERERHLPISALFSFSRSKQVSGCFFPLSNRHIREIERWRDARYDIPVFCRGAVETEGSCLEMSFGGGTPQSCLAEGPTGRH